MFQHIGNVDHLEIVLPMKNKDLVLDLRLNIDILSKGFKQIFQENGKLKVNQPNMNVSCFGLVFGMHTLNFP